MGFVLTMVLGGPLLEEIGWRGFALPRLQRRHGPLVAALVLGVLWALWHLPQFLVPTWAASSGGGGVSGIALFVLVAVAFSVVLSWVFNNTRGGLLIVVLVHTSIDAFSTTMGTVFPAAHQRLADDHRLRRRGRGADRRDPRQVELRPTAGHPALGAVTLRRRQPAAGPRS